MGEVAVHIGVPYGQYNINSSTPRGKLTDSDTRN